MQKLLENSENRVPFFTVVVPCYNRGNFIVDTVKSILNQDFGDYEILIVDDGSTDDTRKIIRAIIKRDDRVKYVHKLNGERGAARNHGFKQALGQYVVFFDSDDLMHSNHLSTLVAYLENDPNINFIATKYDFIYDGKYIAVADFKELKEQRYSVDLFLKGNILACNFCVRKNNPSLFLFEEKREYAIMEDWMFLVRNLANDSIFIIDKVTISMLDHADRSMRLDNHIIINKRRLANDWIKQNVNLKKSQLKILDAYTFYFCAIHHYIDSNRPAALNDLFRSIKQIGVNRKFIVLLVKVLLGRKQVQKFSKHVS